LKSVLPAAFTLLLAAAPAIAKEGGPRPGDITTGSMIVFTPQQQPLGSSEWSLGAGYTLAVPPGSVAPPVFPILGMVWRADPNLEVSALVSPNTVVGFRVPHVQAAGHALGSGFELQAQLDPRPGLPGGVTVPGMGTANLGLQYVLESTTIGGIFEFHTMPSVGYYTRGAQVGLGFAADFDFYPIIAGAGANLRFWYDPRSNAFVPDQRLGAGARYILSRRMFLVAAYNAFIPEGTQALIGGLGYHLGD